MADTLRMEHIIFAPGSQRSRWAVKGRLTRTVGVADHVVTALVLELTVMLIKEDMKVCSERARQILENMRLGETLHGDE
jgi:hypothetical protein